MSAPQAFNLYLKRQINLSTTHAKFFMDFYNLVSTSVPKIVKVWLPQRFFYKFSEVLYLEIHTVDYKPMKGSSYIPLPDFIMRKKADLFLHEKDGKSHYSLINNFLRLINSQLSKDTTRKKYLARSVICKRGFTSKTYWTLLC